MSKQLFVEPVPLSYLTKILERCCIKRKTYYQLDENAYRIMVFHGLHEPFLAKIIDHYHLAKQFYVTRRLTYVSFVNLIRQICKSHNVPMVSKTKYNESKYTIEHFVYLVNEIQKDPEEQGKNMGIL
jgi:hypothetical protein